MGPIQVLAIHALFITNTNFLNANTAREVRPLLIGAKIPSVDVTTQQGEPISL